MPDRFVHLHNHSEYSLLDGMLRITDLEGKPSKFLKRLAAEKVSAFAITDHGNMYGAMDFYTNAIAVGIKPILGCELYITPGKRTDKTKEGDLETGHIIVLVENMEGYRNLTEMLSLANIEGFYRHPRIDFELLEKYRKGLIFLSGCLKSLIANPCSKNDLKKATEIAAKFKDILGTENFYIELMDHGMEEEKIALKNLLIVAEKLGLKTVATNDCHYENKDDWFAHDVYLCISTNSTIDKEKRMKMEEREYYYKSPDEMINLFKDIPDAIKNTLEISSRCNIKFATDKIFLPKFKVDKKYYEMTGGNEEEAQHLYLKDLCEKGLKEKCPNANEKYKKRLDFELETIKDLGFSSYFLIVMDFIKFARENNIPVGPGRGSGAGSLVAYLLDITRIDPIKNELLFERFLSPGRKSMPDLDIDFSDEGREKVINYVKQKYGENNVASIITYGTIMAKTAIKDVGRALGLTPTQTNNITKYIPANINLAKAIEEIKELKEIRNDEQYKKLFDVALKVEGLRRHTSVHAAGVVITDKPIMKYVPVASREGIITTQYDGNTLTNMGLLKVDFLGLRTLTVISNTAKLIVERKNREFDIEKIPFDDEKTFKLLSEGKTTGVFQLESDGMKKLVQNLKPTTFSDIAALVALYRPGPIQAGMTESFVKRKHGKEKIVYDHPALEDILKTTYGTIIYQEQVMEIAKRLAGFTPREADDLRKAMGKKIPEVMEENREKFIKGCEKNNINHKIATKIYNQMVEFAGYGFNKSHSVAYAKIAYQTAYLKANYPLEFMTALLTSEIGHGSLAGENESKIIAYIEEAHEMGIITLPPDINKSFPQFSIEDNKNIRYAFTAIKNIGDNVAEEIVKEREKNGEYKSYIDFISRNNSKQINKKVLEALAKSGAFDSLYKENNILEKRKKALEDISKDIGDMIVSFDQTFLFEKKEEKQISEHEMLKNEKEVLGLYISGHPLVSYRKIIKMISKWQIQQITSGQIEEGARITLCGIINQIKSLKTKTGKDICKFELEDLSSSIEVIVFNRELNKYKDKMVNDKIVAITGIVKLSNLNKYEIMLEEINDIYEAIAKWSKNFVIFFDGKAFMSEDMKELKQLYKILEHNKGDCPVFLRIDSTNKNAYVLETEFKISVNKKLISEIENILGANSWQIKSAY